MNLLATPGLGSILVGRVFVGSAQLLLALAGFLLVLLWFALTLAQAYSLANLGESGPVQSYGRYGLAGLLLFAAAWLWSLATGLRLWLQTAEAPPPVAPAVPPRIEDVPRG
ncbi:MAG: hypothetical protein U1F98_03925 [Verrucomicrobiota bacterium]